MSMSIPQKTRWLSSLFTFAPFHPSLVASLSLLFCQLLIELSCELTISPSTNHRVRAHSYKMFCILHITSCLCGIQYMSSGQVNQTLVLFLLCVEKKRISTPKLVLWKFPEHFLGCSKYSHNRKTVKSCWWLYNVCLKHLPDVTRMFPEYILSLFFIRFPECFIRF